MESPENCPKNNVPENRPNARMTRASLDSILSFTRERVASLRPQARELERAAAAASSPLHFDLGLQAESIGVIAEIKRRSPSAGDVRRDLDPVALGLRSEERRVGKGCRAGWAR